jgi:hypothetical protein
MESANFHPGFPVRSLLGGVTSEDAAETIHRTAPGGCQPTAM